MTTHRFTATRWHNVLATLPHALTVASGDILITETIDAHGFDKEGVQRAPEPNPMNGPIFVTGAEPGDALKIEILRMTPIRATGWTRDNRATRYGDLPLPVCELACARTVWLPTVDPPVRPEEERL